MLSNLGMTLEDFEAYWREMRKDTLEASCMLCERGWWTSMDWQIGLFAIFLQELLTDPEGVDAWLAAFFQDRIDLIQHKICEAFPGRAGPITTAFEAHKEGKYFLSVPVILAQADGIAKEVADYRLFESEKRDKKVDSILGVPDAKSTLDVMLEPLRSNSSVALGKRNADTPGEELRRHAILHGDDSAYGTQLVACKAVSLLNFVAVDLPSFVSLGKSRASGPSPSSE